jgi:hypothetical protein
MPASTDYGRDTFCGESLRTGRYASRLMLVGQNIYHRLTTKQGALQGGPDEEIFGFDISAYVGRSPRGVEAALPAKVRAEVLKDPRVLEVAVTVIKSVVGPATSFATSIAAKTIDGTVTTRMAVSDVSAQLLGIDTEDT